ncbi:electron transport complex protein RnfD [Planctomycetes bacterium Poly30]|uniref:Electron transport complex protein RnfD n=2 Tax=Saltatorellus ferox TaxID=2528018 RepID=A0A518EKM6_9BACT|nr:electron transport complex protein RnfD [Planctomycetes bacterium Poly30]
MKSFLARVLPTPKHAITALITTILVVGEWRFGIVGGFEKILLTLGACVLFEEVLSRFVLGRRPVSLQGAYISGVSLTILIRPQDGLIWPFVAGAFLTIASKYVLRYRSRHLWNPSNIGIAALVLLAPAKIAILSHEFGNDIAGNAVIWGLGLLVATRARVLHISVTYAISFAVLAFLRSAWTGTPVLAELAPLTGPMYQLMAFFMLTDPRTTVGTRRGRIVVVALIALVEALIRLGNDLDVPYALLFAPAPPILALAIVGPLALALDLRRREPRPSGLDRSPSPALS